MKRGALSHLPSTNMLGIYRRVQNNDKVVAVVSARRRGKIDLCFFLEILMTTKALNWSEGDLLILHCRIPKLLNQIKLMRLKLI